MVLFNVASCRSMIASVGMYARRCQSIQLFLDLQGSSFSSPCHLDRALCREISSSPDPKLFCLRCMACECMLCPQQRRACTFGWRCPLYFTIYMCVQLAFHINFLMLCEKLPTLSNKPKRFRIKLIQFKGFTTKLVLLQ